MNKRKNKVKYIDICPKLQYKEVDNCCGMFEGGTATLIELKPSLTRRRFFVY